ncbi:MAG: 4Fe-4S dicluster domain-containing protein [Candidatus Marinimicrobia bacterium]|nr:4Fe-4S dicluster domain-containing protein [Candidatus Neomarinimicrobiota bacterium]
MLVDLNRCYGCKACAIACKAEFDVRLGVYNSNVIEYEHGKYPKTTRSFLPWLCNHCSDAPCVDVCPADPVKKNFNGKTYDAKATYKRPDGMVLYDQNRCLGCHACVEECPYKARYVDPLLRAGEEPDNQAIGKCTFCQHRVDRGLEPSCVNTCPGNARIFGDLDDPNAAISKIIKKNKNRVKGLKEGYGTHPNVFYLNLFEDTYTHGSDIRNNAPASGGQNRKA